MVRLSQVALIALSFTMVVATGTLPSDAAAVTKSTPTGRYFVVMERTPHQLRTRAEVVADQLPVISRAEALGGRIAYQYSTVLNAFSADLSEEAARELVFTPGVDRVVPVSIVRRYNSDSVPFIGGDVVRKRFGLTGKGITVAVVDSGVDYTHATFNGKGTKQAFERNDPDVVEPGSFPTNKVVGGFDFVGDEYNPIDKKTDNDTPQPDDDPLDQQGHGTHVAGTCCGKGVPGSVGRGVAPKVKILAYKVWGQAGASTSDVLVAAYERAVDPNDDGDTSDRADVLSFSGGVNYGTAESVESIAAQNVIAEGTVFVAAAGNAGGVGSGGLAYRVGAPATAPDVIAVAASTVPQDTIAGFSSQGPARYTSALKPDIAAPGAGIRSAAVGSGDGGIVFSGTSMAAPHVSGAAALMLQRFPGIAPAQVKALLMNRAFRFSGDLPLVGAGRIDLKASAIASFLVDAPSLSFGAPEVSGSVALGPLAVTVTNMKSKPLRVRISDELGACVDECFQSIRFSENGSDFTSVLKFEIGPNGSETFWVSVHEGLAEIEVLENHVLRWYRDLFWDGFGIRIRSRHRAELAQIVWHVVPMLASRITAPDAVMLEPNTGSGTLTLDVADSIGVPYADLYPVMASDPNGDNSFAEADIVTVGVRSFTGAALDDGHLNPPTERDPFKHQTWRAFVKGEDDLSEPIEFVAITYQLNETIESPTATFYIDVGADGDFADEGLQADFIVTKEHGDARRWCLINLAEDPEDCVTTYGGDYPTYLTRLLGVVVDATDLGLTSSTSSIAVRAEVCSDQFSGDVLAPSCDTTEPLTIDVIAPPIEFETLMCDGFWSEVSCKEAIEVTGEPGSQGLVVFPNQPNSFEFFELQ